MPGSAKDKILGSQIGYFLRTKLGGLEGVERLIEDEQLMLLPVADCRGIDTTGLNCYVYITEAQNTTIDMMKLMVQRIDENTKVCIEGDNIAQTDLNAYMGGNNGLAALSRCFRGEEYYSEIQLQKCYRSKIAERAELMGKI